MEEKFKFLASGRTDEELYERVNNREKYLPETVEASLDELKSRGESFSDEELQVIAEDMEARRQQANTITGFNGFFSNADKIKQVEDPDAPAFYSKLAIYSFSIIFSVLFGAIMFAVNVSKTDKKINTIWVILYGLAFTVFEIILAERIRVNLVYALLFGIIGSYPLNNFMWRSFLGNFPLYRTRPVWIPLIIGLAICTLYVLLVINGSKLQ
jgi:hypothetical protein